MKRLIFFVTFFSLTGCFSTEDYTMDIGQSIVFFTPKGISIPADGQTKGVIQIQLPIDMDNSLKVTFTSTRLNFENDSIAMSVKSLVVNLNGSVQRVAIVRLKSSLTLDSTHINAFVGRLECNETLAVNFVSSKPDRITLTTSDASVPAKFAKSIVITGQLSCVLGSPSVDNQVFFQAIDSLNHDVGIFEKKSGYVDITGVFKTNFGLDNSSPSRAIRIIGSSRSSSNQLLTDTVTIYSIK